MEKRNEERLTKMMKEHKAELKRARSNNDRANSSSGGDGGGVGERDCKKARWNRNRHFDNNSEKRRNYKYSQENRAAIRLKWEKRLVVNLDKPESSWTNKQPLQDPEMINWGGYCHSHGYNPIGFAHDSARCQRAATGHDKTATHADRKGGSEDNKPL